MLQTPRLRLVVRSTTANERSDNHACPAHLLADESSDAFMCIHDERPRVPREDPTDGPSCRDAMKREKGELLEAEMRGMRCASDMAPVTKNELG